MMGIFALDDFASNFQLLIRWIHVFAGIIWIGHLYFFNFVNSQLQPTLDGDTKKKVNPVLLGRALWWFRWGAMITLLAGLTLFFLVYMYAPGDSSNQLLIDDDGLTTRGVWILMGMAFGLVMWFNVWFVIWPAQKKILGALLGGPAADASLPPRAAKFSKINTYLSGPMLFGMLAPAHYGSINWPTAIVAIVIAELVIWHFYKFAPKVGKLQ
jgi:uncharacterized membrane protein